MSNDSWPTQYSDFSHLLPENRLREENEQLRSQIANLTEQLERSELSRLKEELEEARGIIDSTPVLILDLKVCAMRGEEEAISYAKLLPQWLKRARSFLNRESGSVSCNQQAQVDQSVSAPPLQSGAGREAEYRNLGMSCVHCGSEIAARRVIDSSIQIKGLHKLEYVHAESGKSECCVRREAQPYDGWQASSAYDAACTTGEDGASQTLEAE